MDEVRVLRILEYTGPRDAVQGQIDKAIHGSQCYGGVTIKAATLFIVDDFPGILKGASDAEGSEANSEETSQEEEEERG